MPACPKTVGGVTVNRYCSSGLTAVAMAADRIRVGEADVMIAGGAESMSMVPMMGNKPSINARLFDADENIGIAYGMGMTAEKVAAQWKVGREAQDRFALASHERAIAAQRTANSTTRSLRSRSSSARPTSPRGKSSCASAACKLDEGPRADTNLEALAKLRPVFAPKGSVTAGNSSQTSDGAGALILVSETALKPLQSDAAGALRVVRRARRAARDHGHRSQRGDSGRLAQRGLAARSTCPGSSSTRPSPRRRWR